MIRVLGIKYFLLQPSTLSNNHNLRERGIERSVGLAGCMAVVSRLS